jgi:glycosyltransferase involved in cell wall biosynthesis
MKIIIYYEQFSLGGVDKHLKELINNWPNKKDNITIITNKSNPGFLNIKNSIKKKIKIVYFNSWSYSLVSNFFNEKNLSYINYFISILQPLFLIITIIKFVNLLKFYDKNCIILSNNGSYPGSWANMGIIFAAKILNFNQRAMLVHHEALPPRRILKLYHKIIDNILSNSITDLICVSKATLYTIKKNRHLKFDKFKCNVIYNDLKLNTKPTKKKLFRDIEKNYILFGIIGRVELYKGHEDVIRSISKIDIAQRAKMKLLIIGEYKLKILKYLYDLSIKLNVHKNVIFTGYIKGNSEKLIKNLDVVIVATRDFEGFGYTALEAIKLGKPLITTDVGGLKEFVNPDYALVIKPKKINQLSSSITKVIKNYKNYKIKAEIYKKKSKEFSMSKEYRNVFCN